MPGLVGNQGLRYPADRCRDGEITRISLKQLLVDLADDIGHRDGAAHLWQAVEILLQGEHVLQQFRVLEDSVLVAQAVKAVKGMGPGLVTRIIIRSEPVDFFLPGEPESFCQRLQRGVFRYGL